MQDIHKLPIKYSIHAIQALAERVQLDLEDKEDADRLVRTAKIVRPVGKDGNTGILQSKIGDYKIRFVYSIHKNPATNEDTLLIITVEVCK